MEIGDKVCMSDRNKNHLGNGVDAYARMEGVVTDIWDDNGFALDCGTSVLVVPLNRWPGVWIWLNNELIYHRRIKASIPKSNKKWYHWFTRN